MLNFSIFQNNLVGANNCVAITDANAAIVYKRGTTVITTGFAAADVATITCNDKFTTSVTTTTCTNDGTNDEWTPALVACASCK